MKIKKKIISSVLSGITALSATLSCLPMMTASAALSRDDLGWNQDTYNYMSTINNGITSLSTTSGIAASNGTNQTSLKSNLDDIQKAGYTFNFSGRVKEDDQYIVVYDGSDNEQIRVSLTDSNFYNKLNNTIKEVSGENFNHVINYGNNMDKYYGSDESGRTVTAISMDGTANNKIIANKTGYSIYDSRNYIGIAHSTTGKDYFMKLPDKNKCKIAMLYKNGGSYIDSDTGHTQDVDVLVTCENYDFADEEVPYLSTDTTIIDDDNEWAYLTADMVSWLKKKGLTTSDLSKRSDNLIYRKLPNAISKKHIVNHSNGTTTTTIYKYEYVIPAYLVSDATSKGIFKTIESYLKDNNLPRRTQYINRYVTNVNTACMRFTDNRPGIYGGGGNWYQMSYKFYKSGTTTPIAVSGYSCWKDIDGQEGVSSADFCDTITTSSGKTINATGAWEISANTNVRRYNWNTAGGTVLTGYFDYKISNSTPSETSNWLFATFENKTRIGLIYSFWGASSEDQKNRLNMYPSGWMMCDLPGEDRDFYATYRVQKVIDDGSGKLYRLENSEYGTEDNTVYNIGFKLTDEDGNVCTLTKRQNSNGETIERGNYSYSKTLNTKDLSQGTLLRASDTGYIYFSDLPLGKYKLVEAVTTKSFNGNQPITESQMIFSDPDAEGNHCYDTFNGATVTVENGQVSITCQGVTIYPVTTEINVSHIINFESDKQDYAANGNYSGIIANGNEGVGDNRTPVNSRIVNSTKKTDVSMIIQKTVTLVDGTIQNATYNNTEQLLKNINFFIVNEEGSYAIIENGLLTGWSDTKQIFALDNNGQAFISGLPFGKYTLTESTDNINVASVWDVNKFISFTLDTTTCNYEDGSYSYELTIDNPELYGNMLVQKETDTGADISNIGFSLTGKSNSGRNISMYAKTDEYGRIEFTKIPVGMYTLTEDSTTVPDGYEVAKPIEVIIKKDSTLDNNIYTIHNELDIPEPKTGIITVYKYDSESKKVLEGAEFMVYRDVNGNGIYDESDSYYTKLNYSNDGIYTKSDVIPDTYFIKETKAPDGYAIDNNYYPVTIDENHLEVRIDVPNIQLPVNLTLTKRIPVDELNGQIWFEHGNPTFIFKVVNTTAGKEYNHIYYKTVEFTKDYVKDHTITIDGVKYVEMSVTFDNLKAGTYTASEQITGQRYKLKSIINVSNGTANGSKCNFTLKPGQTGKATFYNVKNYYDTNTHNSLCVNVFKK